MFSPARLSLCRTLSTVASSRVSRPCYICHGETTNLTTRPWWRALVDGKLGGALRIVRRCGFLGVGRNPCHFDTDVVTLVSVAVPS